MGEIYKPSRSNYWYADYVDHNGERIRKSLRVRDKRNAEELLRKLEGEERLIEAGLRKPKAVTPIVVALEEYLAGLHKSEKYVGYCRQQVKAIARDQLWANVSDINAAGLEQFALGMTRHRKGQLVPASNRTKQSYITALRSFCRWCVHRGYLPTDPTAPVRKPTPEKSKRRMLQRSEWKKLSLWLSAAKTVRNGQEPGERRLLYWTAIETGYRAGELMALTVGSLAGNALSLDAEHTKNKKDARQFISDGLAAELTPFCRRKLQAASIFGCTDICDLAEVLRADCEDADVDPANLDFHCLRHTCGSWLAAAGVPMPELQKIMRHADISTTIKHYYHLAPEAEGRHRNLLGEMLG